MEEELVRLGWTAKEQYFNAPVYIYSKWLEEDLEVEFIHNYETKQTLVKKLYKSSPEGIEAGFLPSKNKIYEGKLYKENLELLEKLLLY